MPFRQAHHVVGQVVQISQEQKIKLSQISLDQFRELSPLFDEDVSGVFDFDAAVARRVVPGGPAPEAVRKQIEMARQWMESR